MKDWESWRYLTGLHYLSEYYTPNSSVLILDSRGNKDAKFKEWRGIISSLVDRTEKKSFFSAQFNGAPDILCISIFKDANSQIVVETLKEYMQINHSLNIKFLHTQIYPR